ncbi:MAG: magnesium transporter [Spirochaetaceae bacterium]|nr:MAG: magnesium transporter [Spirochaetaceae bacterium]
MSNVITFAEYAEKQIRERNLEPLKARLRSMTAGEVIVGLRNAREADRPVVFRLLPKDLAATVFDLMDVAWQRDMVQSFTSDEAVALLAGLDPDDRVHLLDELPAKVAKRLLEQLPRETREATARLMGYEDGTVGRIMSPIRVDVKSDMTVGQAIERIRVKANGNAREITTVYVTNESRQLDGTLPLGVLVTADAQTSIKELVSNDEYAAATVRTFDDQEHAARLLQQLDVTELPVLDRENRLVGALTVDDAMDVLREEVTDDMFDKVGLLDLSTRESDRSDRLISGGFWHAFKVRIPFLLITLAGGIAAGVVIDAFEDILTAVVATAFFIPVIMDMGGNVGTQSSTIFTRAMVLGQINLRRFIAHWATEVLKGFGMAVALGAIGGVVAALWQGIPMLGLAVGVSLTLVITLGVALGFLVPFVLIKLGFDQAAGADPIITTIKDITGLLIYFFAVSLFLPQVLTAM